jgi:uncharacterized protein HemX
MLPPAPLFALSEQDQPTLVWWMILGAIALGPALHSWIKVIEFFKGKKFEPSNYVTQDQLAAMKTERDAQIKSTFGEIKGDLDRLEKTLTAINRELPAIHRALGRLEGHDDASRSPGPR